VKNGNRPVVAIVGAGFGGMNAAKELRKAPLDIILIDRRNYHLFQPLLYQVATAAVSEAEIAYPIRSIFRNQENLQFLMAEVTAVDLDGRRLQTTSGFVDYDYLILAIGSETNYFGMESVSENSFNLKDLNDAESIRNHILRMFELATQVEEPEICSALRTFVVVGGGPTGVECAGALSELIHLVLKKDYPNLVISDVQVVLLEMLDTLLAGFPEELGLAATEALKKKNVEVMLGTTVEDYDGRSVKLKSGEVIPAYTMIWAAGVQARGLVEDLDVEKARQNRVVVEGSLQIPGYPEAFVIGDAAHLEEEGEPLPMLAPVAIQQGKLAARNILNLENGNALEEFEYRDPGSLATIGRSAAVARVGNFKFHGFVAWIVWLAVHLFWLIGFRNRLFVLINWAWDYIFYESGVRLITPDIEEEKLFAET
jgi:NADH:ubiquinone reductase (H+-translocating)